MSRFFGRVGILTIAIVLLLVLNSILLVKDYKNKSEVVNLKMQVANLRSRLHDSAIQIRVFESNAIFGGTFVPRFDVEDLQGNMIDLPYFGSQDMLIVFFKLSDCRLCLENMGMLNAKATNVPIVGVALDGLLPEVIQAKQEFKYEFPIFISSDPSIRVNQSPKAVLVDRNRNILNIAKIEPGSNQVEDVIEHISIIAERR